MIKFALALLLFVAPTIWAAPEVKCWQVRYVGASAWAVCQPLKD